MIRLLFFENWPFVERQFGLRYLKTMMYFWLIINLALTTRQYLKTRRGDNWSIRENHLQWICYSILSNNKNIPIDSRDRRANPHRAQSQPLSLNGPYRALILDLILLSQGPWKVDLRGPLPKKCPARYLQGPYWYIFLDRPLDNRKTYIYSLGWGNPTFSPREIAFLILHEPIASPPPPTLGSDMTLNW